MKNIREIWALALASELTVVTAYNKTKVKIPVTPEKMAPFTETGKVCLLLEL